MFKRLVRLAFKLAFLGALIWLARKLLMRWVDGPAPIPSKEPWPPVVSATDAPPPKHSEPKQSEPKESEPQEETPTKTAVAESKAVPTRTARATPARSRTAPGKPVTGSDDRRPPKKAATKRPAAKKAAPAKIAPRKAGQPQAWVEPINGECPSTHQVKAKLGSMLYRLPGMAAYDRMQPDRCYVSAEAAEADGFTRAKR